MPTLLTTLYLALYAFVRVSVRRTGTCCGVTLSMCFRLAAWISLGLSLVCHLTLSIDGTWLISKSWLPLPSGNFTCNCTQLKTLILIIYSGELVSYTGQSWKIVLYRSNFAMVHLQYCHIKSPCECILYMYMYLDMCNAESLKFVLTPTTGMAVKRSMSIPPPNP